MPSLGCLYGRFLSSVSFAMLTPGALLLAFQLIALALGFYSL
jgi:hypothetical protein